MKKFIFSIDPQNIKYDNSIRSKKDILILQIEIVRYLKCISVNEIVEENGRLETDKILLVICVDKMSRVFIVDQNKIHSFNFPFFIKIKENEFLIELLDVSMQNSTCSVLVPIFNTLSKDSNMENVIEKFWEVVEDLKISKIEQNAYSQIINYLLLCEDGYIRFDYDDLHENADLHPLNHIDVNYSGEVTWKFGLLNKLSYNDLIDMMNTKTPCQYLK